MYLGSDSNRHGPCGPTELKSVMSTNFITEACSQDRIRTCNYDTLSFIGIITEGHNGLRSLASTIPPPD